jgi:hypothetical protein
MIDLETMDFMKDVKIDETALDIELLIQAEQLMQYGQLMAQAKKEEEEAVMNLEVLTAKYDKAIREEPAKFGLERITETAISGAIKRQKRIMDAEQALLEAKYRVNVFSYAYTAIKAKGDNLSNLVKLYGTSYFAGPAAVADISARKMNFLEKVNKAKPGNG